MTPDANPGASERTGADTATRTISSPKSIPTKPPDEGSRLNRVGGRPPLGEGACRAESLRSTTTPSSSRSAMRLDAVVRDSPVSLTMSA